MSYQHKTCEVFQVALGTVQLGLSYGIANSHGKPGRDSSIEILDTAWQKGIRYYDTAKAYGDSESVLGHFFSNFPDRGKKARIITKFSPGFADDPNFDLTQSVLQSIGNLQCPGLWAILLHREEELRTLPEGFLTQLDSLRREGRLVHFGVSCATVEGALAAVEFDQVDVLQIPSNIFDHRWIEAGIPERAARTGKRLFIRSVYLQGLALMPLNGVPFTVPGGRQAVKQYMDFCELHRVQRDHFSFAYIQNRVPEGIPVIGAESAQQVQRNCELGAVNEIDSGLFDEWERTYKIPHSDLIDPSKWK